MAEYDFEAGLERMFAQSPVFSDASAFAETVEARLNRTSRVRTVAVTGAALVGGLIAGSQLIGAGISMRFEQASATSVQKVDSAYQQLANQVEILGQAGVTGVGMFWIASVMLIAAAVVVGAAKAFQEV